MLPQTHLTSHSRMSASKWVIVVIWVIKTFFSYSSSVYSCHLFLVSSASVRSLLILYFIVPILPWNVSLISPIFLKRSLVFPTLFFPSISLHYSFKMAFLSLFAILWNPAFSWIYLSFSPLPFTSLPFSTICKASRRPLGPLAFLFLADGFVHHILYNC